MVSATETELIQKTKNGDLKAFEQIYRDHSKKVYGFCLRMLNHKEDTEDVVQTVFLKLYRGIHRFRQESSLGTYVMSIARNACIDKLKLRQKHEVEELREEEITLTATPLYERPDIENAILALPLRMKECFILFAVEGYPQEEIARILKVELGTDLLSVAGNLAQHLVGGRCEDGGYCIVDIEDREYASELLVHLVGVENAVETLARVAKTPDDEAFGMLAASDPLPSPLTKGRTRQSKL